MIDWSKLDWNQEELEGVAEIRLTPRIERDRMIAVQTHWIDHEGQTVRQDTHIEVLKPFDLIGQAGD